MSDRETPVPPTDPAPAEPQPRRQLGIGRVLITVYAILAIGATSRAALQIVQEYSKAPVPITLSAVSGVVYIVATIALLRSSMIWYRIAWITISFELAGVLIIGTLSVILPSVFAGDADVSSGTVWSYYGVGYLFIPVVLPILGMLWLRRRRPVVPGA
jgi:hypothetical protein